MITSISEYLISLQQILRIIFSIVQKINIALNLEILGAISFDPEDPDSGEVVSAG